MSQYDDTRDQRIRSSFIDIEAIIILVIVAIIAVILVRVDVTAKASVDIQTAPISTPALPTPAPVYYQPLPTLYPVAPVDVSAARNAGTIDNSVNDNSDHRVCVFVINCN